MFDDDTALWAYVMKPLYTQQCCSSGTGDETGSGGSTGSSYLLPFVRSVRTSMIVATASDSNTTTKKSHAECLSHRLRSLLLLESINMENISKARTKMIARSLHHLPFLTNIVLSLGSDIHLAESFPHPQQIRKLHVPSSSISQEVLNRFTNLEDLDMTRCLAINNVHFCSLSLRRLVAKFCWSLNDKGLAKATKLEVLDAGYCRNITTVDPFAATLVELHAGATCGIQDEGLQNAVNIRRLFIRGNPNISSLQRFAANVVELDAFESGLTDKSLRHAVSIVKLYDLQLLDVARVIDSSLIKTVIPFAESLRELHISSSAMKDEGLRHATGIVKLVLTNNIGVTTVKPFAHTLRELHCTNSAMCDEGLCDATGIVRLGIQGENVGITTLSSCRASLVELDVSGTSASDNCINDATSLVKLDASDCISVTSISPFAATLRELRLGTDSGIRVEDVVCGAHGLGRLIVKSFTPLPCQCASMWKQ